jgi:hypothetical protein
MTTIRTGKTMAPTCSPGWLRRPALAAGKGEAQMADEVSPQYPSAVREQAASSGWAVDA